MNGQYRLVLALIIMGAGWGFTLPLSKIAVSDGYRHFGIILWQQIIMALVLWALTRRAGQRLPWSMRHLRLYSIIACLGTLLPNMVSYEAARHLPAGWLSVIISLVPMVAFPIALLLGNDRFSRSRLLGLITGLAGILVLLWPSLQLHQSGDTRAIWGLIAMIAAICYGFEGNYVARWGTEGLGAVQVLLGASIVGAVLAVPLAFSTDSFFVPRAIGGPELAIILSSVIHACVYSSYVWMVGRAGPVFASQVSYLVTGFGVGWSILILGESYSGAFWSALLLMFVGLFLVRPKEAET